MKSYYKSHLGRHPTIADTSPLGKEVFLRCYLEAQDLGMTESNILAGWKASGLWPVNVAKPLLSPLLVTTPKQLPTTPKKPHNKPSHVFVTPSNSLGVKRLFSSLNRSSKTSPISRLILTQTQIHVLEQKVDDSCVKKRAKVKQNPNNSFVTVIEVTDTRRRLEQQLLGTEEAGFIDSSDIEISYDEAIEAQLSNV